MRPVRYSINVSLDGCVDHASAAFQPGRRVHEHAADWIASNDVAIFGRVTYQLMEAWRPDADGAFGDWFEPWMMPFAESIADIHKIIVSSTLGDPAWNTEVIDGSDLAGTVRALREQDGAGIAVGGVMLPLALAQLDLIDEYQLVVHPALAGYGPRLFDGLTQPLNLIQVDQTDLGDGVVSRVYLRR